MFSNGEVVEGQSYSAIATTAHKLGFRGEKINGFVTSAGDFVDPVSAIPIALQAGQIKEEKDKLEPEDIWPHLVEE